ncbi:hypothetical protein CEXT_39191 [Caerostris extrusa]|uniref:Uncharacterized protein n=1 Tax=Caerostris extrusa TaxID=172846 RepID=A0AAV4X2N3_CAEEX|nr:hypothetical protein CEXT_39191 [Caerostris extrusa]
MTVGDREICRGFLQSHQTFAFTKTRFLFQYDLQALPKTKHLVLVKTRDSIDVVTQPAPNSHSLSVKNRDLALLKSDAITYRND